MCVRKNARSGTILTLPDPWTPTEIAYEAVISLPENRIIRNFRSEVLADYSTPDKEYAAGLFPLYKVFDCSEWRNAYNEVLGL